MHKYVLYIHSAYFRAYFETLSPNSSSASDDSHDCHHPTIAHCIHLPQQSMLVTDEVVNVDTFDCFLRHLYFSSLYCYPPFLPKKDIDLKAEQPPLSQTFPRIDSLDWAERTPVRCREGAIRMMEFLLALAHYFDCAHMLRQCERIMITQIKWAKRPGISRAWLVGRCLVMLRYCDRYKLITLYSIDAQ